MTNQQYLLRLPLIFPAGLAAGAGKSYNQMLLARNGINQPVLRGTSLAGVLRHTLTRNRQLDPDGLGDLFGQASAGGPEDATVASKLKVSDCILQFDDQSLLQQRTHHLRDRHTKTVVPNALFSLESCPPQTTTVAWLWLDGDDDSLKVLEEIAGLFDSGLQVGGNSARGIGRAVLNGNAEYRRFDLSDLDQHADYLDTVRTLQSQSDPQIGSLKKIVPSQPNDDCLKLTVELSLPRGQDILVADGQGTEYKMQPQTVLAADGVKHYRIPGSTLRGAFRDWMTKLAARDGKPVADSLQRRQQFQRDGDSYDQLTGDNLGHCFLPPEQREQLAGDQDADQRIECPIAQLFGSLYQASRIQFSDALVKNKGDGYREQSRMHVAIDRFTGGAAESMLFDNTVLVADQPEAAVPWTVQISIRQPKPDEVAWLAKSLVALDIGVLRIGSSKSAGRLQLHSAPLAIGPEADQINSIVGQHVQQTATT